MKKSINSLEVFLLAGLILGFAGCKHDVHSNNEGIGTDVSKSNVSVDMVKVPGGTVTKSKNKYVGVFPQSRTVTLSDFYMGKYEVTQAEYKEAMKNQKVTVDGTEYTLNAEPSACVANSSDYALDIASLGEIQERRPVDRVNWYDAVYYCNARSIKEGFETVYTITVTAVDDTNHISAADVTLDMTKNGYRLPTEAEWEYAARGGSQTEADWNYIFSGADTNEGTYKYGTLSTDYGLDAVGWYRYNNKTGITGDSDVTKSADGKGTHQVGKKTANRLGIYDMSGNVWEWCWDWYDDSVGYGTVTDPVGPASGKSRVLRGGSWCYPAHRESVSVRNMLSPVTFGSCGDMGFRVVRSCSKD